MDGTGSVFAATALRKELRASIPVTLVVYRQIVSVRCCGHRRGVGIKGQTISKKWSTSAFAVDFHTRYRRSAGWTPASSLPQTQMVATERDSYNHCKPVEAIFHGGALCHYARYEGSDSHPMLAMYALVNYTTLASLIVGLGLPTASDHVRF